LAGAWTIGAIAISSAEPLIPAVALAVAGGISGWQADKRSDRRQKRRLKFWRKRFGAWLFKVMGKGVSAKRQIPALTNRPTELAVGQAVTSLFEALPAETRASMSDLPEVVAGLEADAQRMRDRIADFNSMLQHAGASRSGSDAPEDPTARRQGSGAVRIANLRDEARRRLADSVAALENLRVDLLRLSAGTAKLESVTTRLGKARDLADQVDLLLEGQLEVEELLE